MSKQQQQAVVRVPLPRDLREPTSLSNFQDAQAVHVSLALRVDFDTKVLSGTATLSVVARKEGVSELVLDTSAIQIDAVRIDGDAVDFQFGEKHAAFGTPLQVSLPSNVRGKGKEFDVEVDYMTAAGSACSALQWLSPEQTAGKKHPYVFSQNQAIHCRSMVPCQDAPAAKITYDAEITVSAPLVALMSAKSLGKKVIGDGKLITYEFDQKVPVSTYLIALAVGELVSREIGPRSKVWSEPSMVEKGAFEFMETETFLKTAEEICGPYVWSHYDLLLLPPSFPYGGMENPSLTFVTPTVLAGDRSGCNLVAHEISHSWSGNLCTNATWSDFWLNEGFTVFIERRIVEKMFGPGTASLKKRAGWNNLKDAVNHFGRDHPFTRLHVPMDNVDPDDSFSSIPYEKGSTFLYFLEDVIGGAMVFEKFLKAYFLRFQFGTVSKDEFKTFFIEYSKEHGIEQEKLDSIDWDTWFNKPGMPPYQPPLDNSLIAPVEKAAKHWAENGRAPSDGKDDEWNADQQVAFLEMLLDDDVVDKLDKKVLDLLDSTYGFGSSGNKEILFRWCLLFLKLKDESRFGIVSDFVAAQGRMKFVRPLYRELFKAGDAGKKISLENFKENKEQYHAIAQKMIARDLNVE